MEKKILRGICTNSVVENLYNTATSAVFCNNNIGDWFRTTVGVRQGCLLSSTLFNIFLERIVTDAVEGHRGTVSIGGRPITNLRVVENLYNTATSAVFCNNNIGDWFRTTVGVRQGCLLFPTSFNIFLERIMTDARKDHRGTVSIGGRPITNLRFADDIDGLAGNECELASLVEQLDKASSNFGMEISAEKTKIMANRKEPSKKEIKVNGQILERVTKFKYLGSIITDEKSKPEILPRIAQTTAALTKLKPIWNNKNISISSKIRLLRSLVMSIFLYACESWTLNADIERRIRAMEMRCYRRLLGISYKDHTTNEEVSRRIVNAIGPHVDHLTIVQQRKLKWYGHTTRSSGLAKTIMQGTAHPKPTHYRLQFSTCSFTSFAEVFSQVGEYFIERVCPLSIPIFLPNGVDVSIYFRFQVGLANEFSPVCCLCEFVHTLIPLDAHNYTIEPVRGKCRHLLNMTKKNKASLSCRNRTSIPEIPVDFRIIPSFQASVRPGRRWRGSNPRPKSPCRSQSGFAIHGASNATYECAAVTLIACCYHLTTSSQQGDLRLSGSQAFSQAMTQLVGLEPEKEFLQSSGRFAVHCGTNSSITSCKKLLLLSSGKVLIEPACTGPSRFTKALLTSAVSAVSGTNDHEQC
ncbi:endonuclease-reverse transcriptase [Plakobranchus ocellatus]|uniref:Endonuclease-reverse transcriptase n=1 Tax=Plakobranchus ocellatus TaxID=259542 RepID=A0AAV4B9I0_9GAST|nr:endonuclease-reverse transcriptase [Plakobranchus ocellatus]